MLIIPAMSIKNICTDLALLKNNCDMYFIMASAVPIIKVVFPCSHYGI